MRMFFHTVVIQLVSVMLLRPARILGASVTVDDNDPVFIYMPSSSWQDVEGLEAFDFGGSHKLTEDPAAYAEITFSFTSFSFASALYPYQIAVIVFIDDATDPVYIDLQDYDSPVTNSGPGTVPHQVVYTSPTEEYAQHTLRILIPDDELYAVVDQITFEIPENLSSTIPSTILQSTITLSSDSSSTSLTAILSHSTASSLSISSSANPTTSSFASDPTDSDSKVHAERRASNLEVALAVVGTILGISLFLLLWWWCRRRSRKQEPGDQAISYQSPLSGSPEPKTRSLRDGRASTTILDGRATASALDGLSTPQVRLVSVQPIISKDTIYAPRHHHPLSLSDGSSTPRSTTITPSVATPIVSRAAKLTSSHPINRMDSSSYYDAAHSVVGTSPKYTSTSRVTPNGFYGYGDGLGDDDYAESRERLG